MCLMGLASAAGHVNFATGEVKVRRDEYFSAIVGSSVRVVDTSLYHSPFVSQGIEEQKSKLSFKKKPQNNKLPREREQNK